TDDKSGTRLVTKPSLPQGSPARATSSGQFVDDAEVTWRLQYEVLAIPPELACTRDRRLPLVSGYRDPVLLFVQCHGDLRGATFDRCGYGHRSGGRSFPAM